MLTLALTTLTLAHAGGLHASAPTTLGCLDGTDTCYAIVLNAGGTAVGVSYADDPGPLGYAFLPTRWDGAGPVALDLAGAYKGEPRAINDSGQVIGRVAQSGADWQAATWVGDTLHTFGANSGVNALDNAAGPATLVGLGTCYDPVDNATYKGPKRYVWDADAGGYVCEALSRYVVSTTAAGSASDINDAGSVVGSVAIPTGPAQPNGAIPSEYHGFTYEAGVFELIDERFPELHPLGAVTGLTESGSFSGLSGEVNARQPWVWRPFEGLEVLGQPDACGYVSMEGHNDADQVLVQCGSSNGSPLWLWDPETGYTEVGPTRLLIGPGLNVHGAVAANDPLREGGQRAYVYLNGDTVWLQSPDGTGATGVYDINDDNVAAGYYEDAEGHKIAATWQISFAAPTPEELIDALAAEVHALVDAGVLNKGNGTALLAKLATAKKKLDQGQPCVAFNLLDAFIQQVQAKTASGTLSPEQGDTLTEAATDIQNALEC